MNIVQNDYTCTHIILQRVEGGKQENYYKIEGRWYRASPCKMNLYEIIVKSRILELDRFINFKN